MNMQHLKNKRMVAGIFCIILCCGMILSSFGSSGRYGVARPGMAGDTATGAGQEEAGSTAGAGGAPGEGEAQTPETDTRPYAAAFTQVTPPEGQMIYGAGISAGKLVYPSLIPETGAMKVCSLDPHTGMSEDLFTTDGEEMLFFGMVRALEGGGFVASHTEYGSRDTQLIWLEKDGSVTDQITMRMPEGATLTGMSLTPEGRIFLSGLFEGGFSSIREWQRPNGPLVTPEGLPKELGSGGGFVNAIGEVRGSENVLFATGKTLYRYDAAKSVTEKVLNWQDVDIDGTAVQGLEEADGIISVLLMDYASGKAELAELMEDIGEKSGDEPIELTLATASSSSSLSKAVAEYNRSQKRYRVKVETFMTQAPRIAAPEDIDQMVTRMLGDRPFDLIDLSGFEYADTKVDDLVKKGYLTDLTPYFQGSTVLNPADFEEKALALCRVGDFQAAIPRSFFMWVYVAAPDLVRPGEGLALEDLMDADLRDPDRSLFEGAGEWDVLRICLRNNLGQFVDVSTGACRFESEEFRQILEYAARYAGQGDEVFYFRNAGPKDLLMGSAVEQVFQLQTMAARDFGGAGVLCGYPTYDGSLRTTLDTDYNDALLAICSRSDHPEGAWEFIEYYLQREFDEYAYGLPANKQMLEAQIERCADQSRSQNSATVTFGTGEDSYSVKMHPLTEEEIETFRLLLDAADDREPVWVSQVYEIIVDELGPYFAGQKSLEEVLGIIQSRVGLYVAENTF